MMVELATKLGLSNNSSTPYYLQANGQVEAINKVHHCYNPTFWRERNHYIFWFHDATFECIANSFKVEVYRESMAAMLTRMCQRLVS